MVTTYRIEAGGYRAEVVPTGAALRMCEFEHNGPARALTETWPAGSPPPLAAGVVLAPWPNRIRDGRFDFDGIEHQLEITEPKLHNASHGLVRKREWRLDSHEPTTGDAVDRRRAAPRLAVPDAAAASPTRSATTGSPSRTP